MATKKRKVARKKATAPRFVPTIAAPIQGELSVDATGEVYYLKPGAEPVKVSEHDSLCGIGIFSTGKNDPLIEACTVHDHTYLQRKFIEAKGWNREIADNFFLQVMLFIADDDRLLQAKAHAYYRVVRLIGGIFYYRH